MNDVVAAYLPVGLVRTCASCSSRVWLFAALCTAAHQAPEPVGLSRKEYCSGVAVPPPGVPLHPGTEPTPLAGGFFTTSTTWEAPMWPGKTT